MTGTIRKTVLGSGGTGGSGGGADPITENVSKVIDPGGGGDFLTLNEAATWINANKFVGVAVTLKFVDGAHAVTPSEDLILAGDGSSELYLTRVSGTPDIKFDDMYFYVRHWRTFRCYYLTMDFTDPDYSELFIENIDFVYLFSTTMHFEEYGAQIDYCNYVYINTCTFDMVYDGGYGILEADNVNRLEVQNSNFTDLYGDYNYGIDLDDSVVDFLLTNNTFTDCDTGIDGNSSHQRGYIGINNTFTNCSTDISGITLNEVSDRGSLVTDDSGDPITFDPLFEVSVAPLSGAISKTVGAASDFATMAEFLTWYRNTLFAGADITVTFTAASHVMPNTIEDLTKGGVNELHFKGASAATTRWPHTMSGIYTTANFSATGMKLRFEDIGFEISDSWVGDRMFINVTNCDIYFQDCNCDEMGLFVSATNSHVELNSLTWTGSNATVVQGGAGSHIDVIAGSYTALVGTGGVLANLASCSTAHLIGTITSGTWDNMVRVDECSHALDESTNTATDPYNGVTLNEIQPDGSYVTDGSALVLPDAYNHQTGTTYTIAASDNGKTLTFNNAAAIAVTLPDTLDDGFSCIVIQLGAGVPTVTRSGTDTINGAAAGVTPSAQWKAMYLSQYGAGTWLALL